MKQRYATPTAPEIQDKQEAPKLPVGDLDTGKSVKKSGAIEYSPEFRKHLADAYSQAKMRGEEFEAAFPVNANGSYGKTSVQQGEVSTSIPSDSKLYAHTHPYPKYSGARPSGNDVSEAKRLGKPIITASSGGMYETDETGHTEQLADNSDWENPKKHLKSEDEPSDVDVRKAPYSLARNAKQ